MVRTISVASVVGYILPYLNEEVVATVILQEQNSPDLLIQISNELDDVVYGFAKIDCTDALVKHVQSDTRVKIGDRQLYAIVGQNGISFENKDDIASGMKLRTKVTPALEALSADNSGLSSEFYRKRISDELCSRIGEGSSKYYIITTYMDRFLLFLMARRGNEQSFDEIRKQWKLIDIDVVDGKPSIVGAMQGLPKEDLEEIKKYWSDFSSIGIGRPDSISDGQRIKFEKSELSRKLSVISAVARQEERISILLRCLLGQSTEGLSLVWSYSPKTSFEIKALDLMKYGFSENQDGFTDRALEIDILLRQLYKSAFPMNRGVLLLQFARYLSDNPQANSSIHAICLSSRMINMDRYRGEILNYLSAKESFESLRAKN